MISSDLADIERRIVERSAEYAALLRMETRTEEQRLRLAVLPEVIASLFAEKRRALAQRYGMSADGAPPRGMYR